MMRQFDRVIRQNRDSIHQFDRFIRQIEVVIRQIKTIFIRKVPQSDPDKVDEDHFIQKT